jgi:hypothetical protein
MLKPDKTEAQLKEFAEDVFKESRRRLQGNSDSRTLSKSLDYEVNPKTASFTKLGMSMEDYGIFQDLGVRGKESSAKAPDSPFRFGTGTAPKKQFKLAINGWLIRKGIAPRDKNGKFIPRASLAFLIRRSIYNTGLRPKRFFTDPFEDHYKQLPNKLTEAYAIDVENFMEVSLNKKSA